MEMWWLHPWPPRAGNVPWYVTSLHSCPWAGTDTKPKSWCFAASPSGNENPGDNSAWLSSLFIGTSLRTGTENMGEVQGENVKHSKHYGKAIVKMKQDLISFSSSLESCSSPSASPQSGWCCMWEDQRYLFFSFWWHVFAMRQWGRNHCEKISEEINESEGIAACSSAAISDLKEQNPVAPVKQLKTTIIRDWAWETETALVC